MIPFRTLGEHAAGICAGRRSSRDLVEAGLAAIRDPAGEGGRAFTKVYSSQALSVADVADTAMHCGLVPGPLMGLPISIKDLFDVAGEPTPAGSVVLADSPPAGADAPVVARLRAAGAVIVGRTNMTEFAFSGLGINPHYGTPKNPFDRVQGRIPGGSSSGAAVSVSDGMVVGAIGTDTGGSIRIPAALCGLTGFKPTARRVPREGMFPLSMSLDSVGTIAPTVACCALLDGVISGSAQVAPERVGLVGVRIGVLQGYVLDDLDLDVAQCFESALSILSEAGAQIIDIEFEALPQILDCNRNGGLTAADSYTWHHRLLETHSSQYDPRVLSRILRGRECTAGEYRALIRARHQIIGQARNAFSGYDIWVLPTVPRVAPLISELEASDEAYFAANAAMLRNPSVFNFLNGCALSIPCHFQGDAPVGLMLAAPGNHDRMLLRIGQAIQTALFNDGRGMAVNSIV